MMLGSRCPEEFASPSISRNQATKIQGTPDYSNNRLSNHSYNNHLYTVPNNSNMFPHHPNANNFDVRLQSVNIKIPGQNLYRVPRQESSSHGFPERQLPWQVSMQGPGEQQIGGIGRGTGFSDAKFPQQQQQPQEMHWQEQHHNQDLDPCKQQNMQQEANAEFPETSYSALLHGPDTPPSQPEPAWITPVAEGESSGTARSSKWSLKGVTGTPVESFTEGTEGPLFEGAAASGTQHFLQDQLKNKLKVPSRPCAEVPQMCDVENVEEKTELHPIPDTGSTVQSLFDSRLSQQKETGFPDQKWDGQNQCPISPPETTKIAPACSGQSLSEQQHVMNTDLERRDGTYNQFQSQGAPSEDSAFKQQANRVLPFGEMPNGSALNGIDLQQYSSWNAPSMSRAFGNHLQHPADANYIGWGMNAWQGGHFMEHTSCLPYASGNTNMGPSHAQYGWQTQSAATGADGFSQFYPEGYYSAGNSCVRQEASFGGTGETGAFPSAFESYGQYQGSQGYHPPANQFAPGFGIPVNGAGWNEFSGPHNVPRQENEEKRVYAGEQLQPQQFECGRVKASFVSQPASKVVRTGQEMSLKSVLDTGTDQGSPFDEKDVELEGPQVKKQREFSEVSVGTYHSNNCQPSNKFPSQPTSDEFERAFRRSDGAGHPHQREFIPGIRFVPSAEHLQEHPTLNGYFPRGSAPSFREEPFSAGRNFIQPGFDFSSMSTSQDQPLVDLLRRQLGEQVQVANSAPLKSPVYQQSIASVSLETSYSETGMSPYAATQELSESQCTAMRPPGGPSSVFISTMRNQDVKDEHSCYGNPGHDYSSTVNGGEHAIPYFNPEVQEQLGLYPVHPSQLQAQVQMPEMNEFAYPKAGPSDTNAHFRGFSRPSMGKFYPPPPFQSHPVHPQRESTRFLSPCLEDQTFREAWAPRIFESAVVASGTKEFVRKPVNNQASSGSGMFYQPSADELAALRKSMSVTELEGMRQQGFLSSEGGSVSKQHPESTLFGHSQSPDQIVAKRMVRGIHSRSMTVESQGSAGPLYRFRDNEQLRASQPSAYAGTVVSGRTLVNSMQIDGDQHQPGYYNDHYTVGLEHSALRDGESTISSKVGSEKIAQHQFLTSKSNLRSPAALHPKKRKKPVSYLVPWHIVATQPRGQLPSISKAELMWASAANRLPEKDVGDVPSIDIFRAESRLRLATQLMQQILSPLPSVLMHGNQPFNLECGVYNLAKLALGEACRLMAGSEKESEPSRKCIDTKTMASHGQTRMWNLAKEVAMARLVERLMERIKRLDLELSRLDCSMSVLGLKGKNNDLEKLSIVHRLGKHHGTEFTIDFSQNRLVEAVPNCGPGIRRLPPQKYVIAVPMPRTLPEGVRCLSL